MILFRYVFSEIARTFALAFLALSSLIFIAFTLTHLHRTAGASLDIMLALFPNLIPEVLLITIPASLLLAVTFTLGRLAGDNELNAMRANGIHLGRLMWPGLLLGALLSVVSAWVIHVTIPRAHYNRRALIGRALPGLTSAASSGLREIRLRRLYIRFKEVRDGALIEADVFIRTGKDTQEVIRAREARLSLDEDNARLILDMQDALITYREESPGKEYQGDLVLGRLVKDVDLSGSFMKKKELTDLSDAEISRALAGELQIGKPHWAIQTEWHRRKALSLAPLVFAFAGAPLAMLLRRGGRIAGLAAVIIPVFVVYFPLTLVGETLGSENRLHPVLATWMANGVVSTAAAVVFKRWVLL
jgi:lipopolysaccharide export system permease protein